MAYLYPISKKKKRDREIYDKSEVYSELKNLSREIKELRLEISDLKKSRKRKKRSRQPKSYSSKEKAFYPPKEYSFSTYSYRSGDNLIKKYLEARERRIEILESTKENLSRLWLIGGGFGAFIGFVIGGNIAPQFPGWLEVTAGFGLLGSLLGWYIGREGIKGIDKELEELKNYRLKGNRRN